LSQLSWNCDLHDLYLLSSWDYGVKCLTQLAFKNLINIHFDEKQKNLCRGRTFINHTGTGNHSGLHVKKNISNQTRFTAVGSLVNNGVNP
jgi:hypothetical protein